MLSVYAAAATLPAGLRPVLSTYPCYAAWSQCDRVCSLRLQAFVQLQTIAIMTCVASNACCRDAEEKAAREAAAYEARQAADTAARKAAQQAAAQRTAQNLQRQVGRLLSGDASVVLDCNWLPATSASACIRTGCACRKHAAVALCP
jgi:hypothetical protein